MPQQQQQGTRPEWRVVHTLTLPNAAEIVCEISRRGDINPRYSVRLGRKEHGADGTERVIPHAGIYIDQSMKVSHALSEMMKLAEDWAEKDRQMFAAEASQNAASVLNEHFNGGGDRRNKKKGGRGKDHGEDQG